MLFGSRISRKHPAGQTDRPDPAGVAAAACLSPPMLDSRGMFPVRIAVSKSAATTGGRWRFGRRIRGRYMAAFYSQLADLLRSGVPLLRSLEILERQSSQPSLAQVVREVRAKVAEGTGLAEAMGQHPRTFDELTVSMVRAGQEGGDPPGLRYPPLTCDGGLAGTAVFQTFSKLSAASRSAADQGEVSRSAGW